MWTIQIDVVAHGGVAISVEPAKRHVGAGKYSSPKRATGPHRKRARAPHRRNRTVGGDETIKIKKKKKKRCGRIEPMDRRSVPYNRRHAWRLPVPPKLDRCRNPGWSKARPSVARRRVCSAHSASSNRMESGPGSPLATLCVKPVAVRSAAAPGTSNRQRGKPQRTGQDQLASIDFGCHFGFPRSACRCVIVADCCRPPLFRPAVWHRRALPVARHRRSRSWRSRRSLATSAVAASGEWRAAPCQPHRSVRAAPRREHGIERLEAHRLELFVHRVGGETGQFGIDYRPRRRGSLRFSRSAS